MPGYETLPPNNFLGLEESHSAYERSAAVILPIPYEGTVSYGQGTREGPRAIIHAARYCEDRQPPAVATLPCATKGASMTSTPASITQGLVVRSVQAGRSPIRPSFASSKVPEHCAPIS